MKKQKTFFTSAVLVFMAAVFLFSIPKAFALTPTFSLTGTGDGDSIRVNVAGDANKSVLLYYTKVNQGAQLIYIGTTDSDGALSTSISTANYGITPNSAVHIMVNGQQSADATWPYLATGSMLSLDKTSLVLPIGQSVTITASNNGTNLLYLSSNSNPPVANVSVSGNKITVTGINYGATTVTVCSQTSVSTCASAYVNVQNTGSRPLAFSQNAVSVAKNQNLLLSVYGGTGAYIILNNSNPGAINASLSGAALTLTAHANEGSSAITVCSSDISACGIINAGIGGVNSAGIKLNQTAPNLKIGESLTISISGGVDGAYSILSNTDDTVVRANVTSNSLVLYGLSGGSATVIVCSSNGNCASAAATVASNIGGDNGPLALSQNNLWLLVGQSFGIKVSGGSTPYSVLKNSDNILTASFADNVLTVTGVNPGSTSINVCSAEGGCTALSVLVNGTAYNTSISLSQNNVSLSAGQSKDISISGNGGYYAANNTNQNVASVSVSGNIAIVSAVNSGNADVSICQNGGQCAIMSISVLPVVPVKTEPDNPSVITSEPAEEKIAGAVAFADNSLVRDGKGRTYLIINNKKKHIRTLAELKKYAGKDIINVADAALSQLPEMTAVNNAPAIFLPNNSLVRDGKGRIYVIINNNKKHIRTLAELKKYAGKKILNVAEESLDSLPEYDESLEKNLLTQAGKFKFKNTLSYGITGTEVEELQKRLIAEGVYSEPVTGRYLTSTVTAVKKYQSKNGIRQTGNVGPLTMGALNR